jgi:hypothetical protein
MIFCELKGGLANMLFQIAGASSIAYDNNTPASFPNLDLHLNYLNADSQYNPNLKHAIEYKKLDIFKNLCTVNCSHYDRVYDYPFEYKNINLEGNNILIRGFFQSEKYFKHNEEYIRNIFKLNDDIKEYIFKKYGEILSDNSTSIHVRRGDYLTSNGFHPVPDINYFQNAIDLTKETTKKYIVFSDDIEWCKTKFIGNRFIFIDSEIDYIDFYMMSYCTNNIISNSSFSWLSAWLNNNKNKTVITPRVWFGSHVNMNAKDLIPEDWIKL